MVKNSDKTYASWRQKIGKTIKMDVLNEFSHVVSNAIKVKTFSFTNRTVGYAVDEVITFSLSY